MILVIGILAAVIVIVLVSKWWADGVVSGGEFLVLSAVYGGLIFGFFSLIYAHQTGPVVLVLVILLGSLGWAAYCNQKLGIRQYYRDKINTYDAAIRADPRNISARIMMADAYYQLGDLDSAIAAIEVATQLSSSTIKEAHKLRQWQMERELRDSKTIVCELCHSKNLWGETLCRTCRQPLVYPTHAKAQMAKEVRAKLVYAAAGVVWLIIALIAFLTLDVVPALLLVVCITLASVGWGILASSKR